MNLSGLFYFSEHTLTASKAIALTLGEVFQNPELLEEIKDEYVVHNTPSGHRISRKDNSP